MTDVELDHEIWRRLMPEKEELTTAREILIRLRNNCLGPEVFDPEGAIVLSHAIHLLHCKIKGEPFEMATD